MKLAMAICAQDHAFIQLFFDLLPTAGITLTGNAEVF